MELPPKTVQQTPEKEVVLGIQLLIDGENVYMRTTEYLKAQQRPSDTAAATEFIIAKLGELVDYIEERSGLRIDVGRYYLTSVGEDVLRGRRMLGGFKEQLSQLGIETVIVEKRNDKSGNVDPRLISEAYRLLFTEKLDENGYVGVVKVCPLRKTINNNRGSLPADYFCDYICATIYPEGYRLIGRQGSIKKTEKGCRVEIVG